MLIIFPLFHEKVAMKRFVTLNRMLLPVFLITVSCFLSGQLFAAEQTKREVIEKTKLTAKETGSQITPFMAAKAAEPTFRFIIQGKERSVVAAAAKDGKFDLNSAASSAQKALLANSQADLKRRIEAVLGNQVNEVSSFKTAINAIVVELTQAEAEALADVPGILKIQKDELRQLHRSKEPLLRYAQPSNNSIWLIVALSLSVVTLLTAWILVRKNILGRRLALFSSFFLVSGFILVGCHEGGYTWIGAPQVWKGVGDVPGTMGEGVVVGVIDSGINPVSDSFAATGDDGYTHTNPKGKYFGVCDPAETVYDPTFPCNDKLIGAWGYPPVNNGNPRDIDGHGSHTAGTSAGNVVFNATVVTPNGKELTKTIAGVSPHSNVIAYSVCAEEGCYLSAILGAINQAILDGVDVINYSIGGGSSDPWADFDSLSFLSAMDAGIFVATSAGNGGPLAETLGSPADAPWITAVAASSHNLQYENWLVKMTGGDTPAPSNIKGHSVTIGYGPAPIVDAADFGNPACEPGLFTAPFNGEIVLCNHVGSTARYARGEAVRDNGGGAMVLNIPPESPDGIGYFMTDSHALPATHILNTDAEVVRTWLSTGTGHQAKLTGTFKVLNDNEGDVLAYFSSRGADPAVPSIVKPNITAPGRAIFAAYHEAYSPADQDYNIIRGTSMSSPHIAGAGALLTAAHPDWSPMQIQSAMMSTAVLVNNTKEDGVRPVDPFDVGAGRIELPAAVTAGLVLNETTGNFLAQDPYVGGDPSTLNLASLGQESCVVGCSWTRTVQNASNNITTWDLVPSPGVTAVPSTFTLNPGDTQAVTVSFDVSAATIGSWEFAEVRFIEMNGLAPDFHMPIAALPANSNLPGSVEVSTSTEAGTFSLTNLKAIEITSAALNSAGLAQGVPTTNALVSDPTNGDPFDAFTNPATDGAFFFTITVPAGAQRLVTEITESDSNDLDLFVGVGPTPGWATLLAYGATGSWDEYVNIANPAAGTYWILVQNWEGGHVTPQALKVFAAVVAGDEGNFTVNVPANQPAGVPFSIDLNYTLTGSAAGDRFYGYFDLGTDPGNPGNLGTVNVDLIRN